ncbi:MAG: Luciferase-like monooxygenase [Actinomycetia bacterium]|nr:Luciferase-like monooxygenase [Actinomycetes bacterium]
MKVRVGYGLGNLRSLSGEQLGALADGLEGHGFDSLWLSERVSGPAPEPMVALAFAAGRTSRIKFGTSVQVLPGRNPALLAKQWATLDALSGGRALPAFGLGIAHPVEQQAFGVARAERAPWFEEALPLIRRFWSEDSVDHDGPRFHYAGMTVLPKPGKPLDVWLGGRAPVELRRVGRLADGWLASFSTPEQCAQGRIAIDEAAVAAGRAIDPEHFGAMVLYSHDELPDAFLQILQSRNPGVDPAELVPRGWPALREACERYVEVGFSKLVLVPLSEPKDWDDELTAAAAEVLPIQT